MYSSLFNRTAAAGSTARPTASLFHHSLNPLTVGHHPPPGFESATDCKCGRKVPSVQPILFISVAMIMVLGVALRTLHQKAGDIRELSRPLGPAAEVWDNGSRCMDAVGGRLKPGWVCMKRLRLERRLNINATELLDDFYIPGVPVVVTRMAAVRDWPVFQDNKWTLGKLQRRYGKFTVSVQVGRESDPDYIQNGEQLSQRVKFADVLHRLGRQQPKSNDYYITANDFLFRQPGLSTMLADIHPLYKGLMRDPDPEDFSRGVDIWMGPKGTVSPLHQDATSLLHTQVIGRKLWRMISPDQKQMLYTRDGLSEVDLLLPWDVLVSRYPRMRDVTIVSEVLEPGETLFLPNGWWHHVTSLDAPTISVSSSRWLPMFHKAEKQLHDSWSEYPWEINSQG